MKRNNTRSLTEVHMGRDLDLQELAKQQRHDCDRQASERQRSMEEQVITENERGMLRKGERQLQMEKQLKKMEREFEMENEMERGMRHEERCMDIEGELKEWEERIRELETKLEKERQAAQEREQELLKYRQEEEAAKETQPMKMERREMEVEEKRTTGVEKAANKGKEWMRELKQKGEKSKDTEARLHKGDEQKVKDKDCKTDRKCMGGLEKPVNGMEWLRELRLKTKIADPGHEMLVEEEKGEKNTIKCGQMEVRREVKKKQGELIDDWLGDMGQMRCEGSFSEIKKKHQRAEEMLRKLNDIKMESKTGTEKICLKTEMEVKREVEKKRGELMDDWLEDMGQMRCEGSFSDIKKKHQRAEEMLRKLNEQIG